jgi:hypothetical protein
MLPFLAVRTVDTDASTGFSACLYHEPEYKRRFPKRSFSGLYTDRMAEANEWIKEHGYALHIYCDAAMLNTALQMDAASVYIVTTPPAYPFAQHLWRYYATLHPAGTVNTWHFRGMDNIITPSDEMVIFDHASLSGAEVIHAPYVRDHGTRYMPVRGSCSVSADGIAALGWWMDTAPLTTPPDWPSTWHNDEEHLARWFAYASPHLRLCTIVDRTLPMSFYRDLSITLEHGQPSTLIRL